MTRLVPPSSLLEKWLNRWLMAICWWMITVSVGSAGNPAETPRFLVSKHATWKFHAQPGQPPANWMMPDFDDQSWQRGRPGFGYGDQDDRTELSNMKGRYQSVFIRKPFSIESLDDLESIFLYLNFDDGFIAYLNGKQVASAFVQKTGARTRIGLHEAEGYERFEIDRAEANLKVGRNVLAIEGHNANIDSSDFTLDPCLLANRFDAIGTYITKAELRQDLQVFQTRLENESSYLTLRAFNYKTAIEQLEANIEQGINLEQFADQLHKLIMQLGDCHAGLQARTQWPKSRSMPFRVAETQAGIAALKIDADRPIDAQCPYLESIDGIPIASWLETASTYVAQGSPQLIRQRSLQWLGFIDLLRAEIPASDHKFKQEIITLGLRSADKTVRSTQRLRIPTHGFSVAKVQQQPSRRLDKNIGYLRIPTMDSRLTESIVDQLRQSMDTTGMVIDVRDNGGGTQDILQAIYGFFVNPESTPRVTNIAAYRLGPRFKLNHIAYRPTYRENWEGWTTAERESIRSVGSQFNPQWELSKDQFSQWHYMVLSRQRGQQGNLYYRNPIVVLCNAKSFSATDNFLNAFAELPQVTSIGQPSGGGSGARRSFTLPNSGFRVSLSSMASFRPNGQTFDGHGVEVDIAAKPTLRDFLDPNADSILDLAIKTLDQQTNIQSHQK